MFSRREKIANVAGYFLLVRLPFPLTLRFKSMLQRGVETPDVDVAWVSSLSWYFLNLFGLRGVFSLLLGEDNSKFSVEFFMRSFPPSDGPFVRPPRESMHLSTSFFQLPTE